MKQKKVILTGFEPFGEDKINPSYEVAKRLENTLEGIKVLSVELPVIYQEAGKQLEKIVEKEKPDLVFCIGQAGGRSVLSFEKVAINYQDARISDNAGNSPMGLPVKENGATAYFSNLPLKMIVKSIREAGIPAEISYTAGTYVCNDLFYHLMEMIERNEWDIKGGFIHVPFLPEQVAEKAAATASMSLDTMINALKVAIEATFSGREESQENMGTIF